MGPTYRSNYSVQVLRGATAIQAAGPEIAELRRRTGQDESPLLCLDFFLGRVRLFPGNEPVVLLARAAGRLEGAVYLYEKLFGMQTGYLRGFDHLTGESTVIAHERARVSLLQVAIQQFLLKTSARVAWATVRQGQGESDAGPIKQQRPIIRAEVSSLRREHRLKLSDTFDATLARFGAHTRRNLRYYRRRAEKELEASFNPQLTFGESDEASGS